MLRLAVTFAVRPEFMSWRRSAGFKLENTNPDSTYLTKIGNSEIHVCLTGVGVSSGRTRLRQILEKSDLCIASGLAGGLRREYSVGSLLVARAVKDERTLQELASDGFLVEMAHHSGAIVAGTFLTSTAIVNSPLEKQRLGINADAVDMESFFVLEEARRVGVPAVAVRAISDGADREMPIDFNRFIDDQGEIGWLPAIREVVKSPRQIPKLIRFGIESSTAARNLGEFLDGYVRVVAGAWLGRTTVEAE